MFEKPEKSRHIVDFDNNILTITIPAKKNWPKLFFFFFLIILGILFVIITFTSALSVILIIFEAIQENVPVEMSMSDEGVVILFSAYFLLSVVLTLFALYTFIWDLAGKEEIVINRDSFIISEQIYNWQRSKIYRPEHIRGLRFSPDNIMPYFSSFHFFKFSIHNRIGIIIGFDYGAKTIRFGHRLEEPEAQEIIDVILEHFPQFG